MQRVLIIEDSRSTARLIAQGIKEQLGDTYDFAQTRAEAIRCLEESPAGYFVALCDLNLPDATNGEVVYDVLSRGVPAVVVSASFDEQLRQALFQRGVSDYVVKRNPEDMQYLLRLLRRMRANGGVEALVVDDSATWRQQVSMLLMRQRITVHMASEGAEALDMLEVHPGIRLVITDHYMPGMDGYELTARIRKKFPMDELAIIAVSAGTGAAARFLKSGANDYLSKQATFEELLCRVAMNLDMQDLVRRNRELAERDELTGLLVRRRFFELSDHALQAAAQKGKPLCAAMLDVDHFKHVNDTRGHLGGDMALRLLGRLLRQWFPAPYLCGRYGGEEFAVVSADGDAAAFAQRLEQFRLAVQTMPISMGDESFAITISIGVACGSGGPLEPLFGEADALLYRAKNEGRNRVVAG